MAAPIDWGSTDAAVGAMLRGPDPGLPPPSTPKHPWAGPCTAQHNTLMSPLSAAAQLTQGAPMPPNPPQVCTQCLPQALHRSPNPQIHQDRRTNERAGLNVGQDVGLRRTPLCLGTSKGSPRHEATGQGVRGPWQGQGSAHTGGPDRGSSGVRGHSSALISLPTIPLPPKPPPPPPAPCASSPRRFPSQI